MNGTTSPPRASGGGINVALGIWLIIAPFLLGFARNEPAKWNDIATGIAVALFALTGRSFWGGALGVWLIISSFVLGFAHLPTIVWNNVILGVLVAIVAFFSRSARPRYANPPPPPAGP